MSIVIAGYYGFGNAGDELILLSLIRRLLREDPNETLTVLSKTPDETHRDFGVLAVDRWRPWTWIVPFLQAKRFVLGGGGLLQETSGPLNHLYYLSLLVIAKLFGCTTEVRAIGVDPIGRPFNRFWTRWVFHHWTDEISVRDEESRQALEDAGVERAISVQADPVSELAVDRSSQTTDRIAIALSPSLSAADRVHEVAGLCNRISERLQCAIDFLVFFPAEDEAMARHIAGETSAANQVRVWQNPRDLLSWVPSYSLVVGSRFHALVLAAACEIPFVGWGEQKKVENFCRTRHMPYANTARGWEEESLLSQIADLYLSRKKSVYSQHELIDFA